MSVDDNGIADDGIVTENQQEDPPVALPAMSIADDTLPILIVVNAPDVLNIRQSRRKKKQLTWMTNYICNATSANTRYPLFQV